MLWSDEFLVGHDELDSQHKVLFGLINSLEKLSGTSYHRETLHEILNSLMNFAIEHFEREEQILREIGYPNLEEHAASHSRYSERSVEFLLSALTGDINLPELVEFLKKWWFNHILQQDMSYKAYLGKS